MRVNIKGAQGAHKLNLFSSLAAGLVSAFLCVGALAAQNVPRGSPSRGESELAGHARALNNSVLQLHEQMQQAGPGNDDGLRANAAPVLTQRAAVLTKLIQTDPRSALTFAFSPELLADLAAKFPQSTSLLESHATFEGPVEHWVFDSADLKTASEAWRMNSGGRTLDLHFASPVPTGLNSGLRVRVTGVVVGPEMAVATATSVPNSTAGMIATTLRFINFVGMGKFMNLLWLWLLSLLSFCALALTAWHLRKRLQYGHAQPSQAFQQFVASGIALLVLVFSPFASFAQAPACSTTGVQKTLVLLATLPGVTPPATPQQVNDIFFGTSTGHALDGFWKEASYGQTSATGDVFGWYTLTGTYGTCTVGTAFSEVMAQAAAAGVNFQNYTRIFFVFPGTIGCGWAGVTSDCNALSTPSGSVTASLSYIVDSYLANRDQGVELVAHEGGHQLGLNHAGTVNDEPTAVLGPPTAPGNVTEFNDFFNTMGAWTLGTYSAAQKSEVLNWMGSGASYQLVQGSGTYTLQPLETNPPGLQALKVQRGTGNAGDYLWVEYRQPIGNYDSTIGFMNFTGALIHYEDTTTGSYTHVLDFSPSDVGTWYNTVLPPGQTWTDPYSNVSIAVLSATSSGLTVSVSYGTAPCTSSAPVISVSPLDPSIYPGQTASYSVTVTNNDSAGCSPNTINLDSTQPVGWTTSLSSSSLTLNPGQSAPVSMGKGAPAGTPVGTYAVNLNASNNTAGSTGTANATVMAPLSLTVSVSVSGASFTRPGSVPITASVTSGGSPASGASVAFTLTTPSGSKLTQSAITNSSGLATWTYKLNQRSPVGTYSVVAQASLSSGSKKAASTQTVASNTATFAVQ
jgi:M6 family metalloprotease-like protein